MKILCMMMVFFISGITVPGTFKPQKSADHNSVNPGTTKKSINIESLGAKANDITYDNAPIIIKALNNADTVIIPAGKTYTTRSCIQVSNLSKKTIIATRAILINRNYDARTFLFINCSNINIIGGPFARDIL